MIELLDCTLRDGSNIVGAGFSKELTVEIIESLVESGITVIEMGHASGLGGNTSGVKIAPLSDEEYIDIAAPYFQKAEIGMFCQPQHVSEQSLEYAAKKKLGFLRVGINAGDSWTAEKLIKKIEKYGIKVRTSLMKAYVLSPEKLGEEAKRLEEYGARAVTIMDSAGYMLPDEVKEYVAELTNDVSIPVGFHGHNNLGLSVANGLAAWQAGAQSLDCGVMGMARSVGNIPTEVMIAVLQRMGEASGYKLLQLLDNIDNRIMPLLNGKFVNPISPEALVLGVAGCHSNFLPTFREIAKEYSVDLYQLILNVSSHDRKKPSKEMIAQHARQIKG